MKLSDGHEISLFRLDWVLKTLVTLMVAGFAIGVTGIIRFRNPVLSICGAAVFLLCGIGAIVRRICLAKRLVEKHDE